MVDTFGGPLGDVGNSHFDVVGGNSWQVEIQDYRRHTSKGTPRLSYGLYGC